MMNEQEGFFSRKHKSVLNIAVWAKYLAWVVLVAYILWAIVTFINYSTMVYLPSMTPGDYISNFFQLWKGNPVLVINGLFATASTVLRGITAFVILKGVSLGLNMIVETDINYRENANHAGAE